MYDLKTATRLYVLEGHKCPVTAVSLSADGRRLVTVAIDERRVVVWKIGTGLLSLFKPGAPPRQGSANGSSSPYRSFTFDVGEDGEHACHV